MRVVVDSNILIKDFHRLSPPLRMLTASLLANHHQLTIPQIVIDEVLNNYRKQLTELLAKESEAVEKFRKLSGASTQKSLTNSLVDSSCDTYARSLQTWLGEAAAVILPYELLDARAVAARAITRRKPFDDSGRGFQDTVIWMGVLSLATEEGPTVALVTNNRKDFAGADATLHPHLVTDWTKCTNAEPPLLFASLEDFIEAEVRPRLEPVDEVSVVSQLNAGYLWGRSVQDDLMRLVEDTSPYVPSTTTLPLPPFAENIEISSFTKIYSLNATDLRKLAQFDMVATLDLTVYVDLQFTIDKWQYQAYGLAEWPHVDIVGEFDDSEVGSLPLVLNVRVDVTIDASAQRITAIQIREAVPVG
ncbi:MAG: PIN domain-containing protein [Dehalococcoidia bacterium]